MKARQSGRRLNVRFLWLPVLILGLALAGCAPPAVTSPSGDATAAPTLATQPAPTAAPTVAMVQETATAAPTVAAEPTAAPTMAATMAPTGTVTTTATVMISTNDTLGEILTDDKGMTLYLFTKDTPNTSNCYDQCATNWPPLLTAGRPVPGAGADDSKLGTTERKDGTTQVTYNGWPLYYWINDMKPGDAAGQGVGGVWFVLDRDGDAVGGPGDDSSSSSSSSGETVKVSIKDFSFGANLTIPAGTTVVWKNEDDMAHTATATNGAFDSGNLDKGEEFSFTFTEAGVFDYICDYHPSMKGTITVTA